MKSVNYNSFQQNTFNSFHFSEHVRAAFIQGHENKSKSDANSDSNRDPIDPEYFSPFELYDIVKFQTDQKNLKGSQKLEKQADFVHD